jgi:hypothetical protein
LKRVVYLGVAVLAIALSVWGLQRLFLSDEAAVRNRLGKLAAAASFGPKESPFVRLTYGDGLASFFTSDVVVNLTGVPTDVTQIQGRDKLRDLARIGRANFQQLSVRLLDIQPVVEADRRTATVHLTVIAEGDGEKNAIVQELKLLLRKEDGKWLVSQMDTVRIIEH